jgi:radical SAM protein with 4Fe4S-binding SPASM domain
MGFWITVNTNATTLGHHYKALEETPPKLLVVSVDGPESIHEKVRRAPGIYRRIKSGLGLVRAAFRRSTIQINCVVLPQNLDYLPEMPEVVRDLGADALEFQLPMFITPQILNGYQQRLQLEFGVESKAARGFLSTGMPLDPDVLWEQYTAAKSHGGSTLPVTLWPSLSREGLVTYFHQPWVPTRLFCKVPWDSLWIEPNGDVVPCPDFPDIRVGNVHRNSLAEIRFGDEMLQVRRSLRKHGLFNICGKCCQLHQDFKPKSLS